MIGEVVAAGETACAAGFFDDAGDNDHLRLLLGTYERAWGELHGLLGKIEEGSPPERAESSDGGPAFPRAPLLLPSGEMDWGEYGISYRDYVAAHAAASIARTIVHPQSARVWEERAAKDGVQPEELIAQTCYDLAESLVAEKAKREAKS